MDVRLSLTDNQLAAVAEAVADLLDTQNSPAREPWPEWMNVDTAARYLDCTPERIRKLVERRQIPFYQEGPRCRIFFNRPELDRWMARFRRQHPHHGVWLEGPGDVG